MVVLLLAFESFAVCFNVLCIVTQELFTIYYLCEHKKNILYLGWQKATTFLQPVVKVNESKMPIRAATVRERKYTDLHCDRLKIRSLTVAARIGINPRGADVHELNTDVCRMWGKFWRRDRDSNPGKVALQRFSRPPQSTALPSLRRRYYLNPFFKARFFIAKNGRMLFFV